MMYLSQSYVSISIYGDKFSPSEFTKLAQLKPTGFGIKGDTGKSEAVLKECFWKYQLDSNNALEGLEESLNSLQTIFRNKIPTIKQFNNKNNTRVKLYVVIKSKNNEDNGVVLDIDFICFLNELQASIEINIYNT